MLRVLEKLQKNKFGLRTVSQDLTNEITPDKLLIENISKNKN